MAGSSGARTGLVLSLIVTAAGAVVTWVVASTNAGVLLLVVGAIGILLSLLRWSGAQDHGP
jgi:uncharacterized membrane protein